MSDLNEIVVVQSQSSVKLFVTLLSAEHQASLSFNISWSLLKLTLSDAIQTSHSLLSPSPPAFDLSQHQGLLQCVGSLHQVANIGASASVLPMNI